MNETKEMPGIARIKQELRDRARQLREHWIKEEEQEDKTETNKEVTK